MKYKKISAVKVRLSLMPLFILLTLLSFTHCKKSDESAPPPATNPNPTAVPNPYVTAHFEFHYSILDSSNIVSIADSLENNYFRVINDLQTDTLPLIKVYFYSDHDTLAAAVASVVPNLPSWAIGLATGQDEIHLMSPNHTDFSGYAAMVNNLIHEYAHCVSLHINASIGNNPRWLWESIAIYESHQFIDPHSIPYMVSHNPPTLATLNSFSNTMIYDVGYLLAQYIVDNWSYAHLHTLIVNNGNTLAALGLSTPDFQTSWFAWVQTEYGI